MVKKIVYILLWIVAFQTIGYYLGQLTEANIAIWYQPLNKSLLNPPGIVFAIVWTILYTLLALVGWALWQRRAQTRARQAFVLYTLQMLMNWTWTPLFFQFHLIELSFYWIVVMLVINIAMVMMLWKNYRFIAWMLIPYVLWLGFASYLNWVIWLMN